MGERITTLKRLVELANEKKCVSVINSFGGVLYKYKPAAFIVSMQGRQIQNLFDLGMYVYEKEKSNE